MKIRSIILICLIATVILFVGYDYSRAESKTNKSCPKIGVVSIRKIFRDSKVSQKHSQVLKAEEDKVNAELNKLKKEIDAFEAALGTLKPNSSDYLKQERDVAQKRAGYQSQKKFYEKQLDLKDREWVKTFYKDILQITGEVAKEKGLDLVFERSEPDLTMSSATGLLMAMQTHKLLYSGGCSDITGEVMARLEEKDSKTESKM